VRFSESSSFHQTLDLGLSRIRGTCLSHASIMRSRSISAAKFRFVCLWECSRRAHHSECNDLALFWRALLKFSQSAFFQLNLWERGSGAERASVVLMSNLMATWSEPESISVSIHQFDIRS